MEKRVRINDIKRSLKETFFKSYLIFFMCLLYIVQFFLPSPNLQIFLSVVCLIVFFSSLSKAQFIPRIFSFGMLITGLSLYVGKGHSFEMISDGVLANLPLLALFVLVPLISIPMKIEGYLDSVIYFMRRIMNKPTKIYGGLTLLLFFLGPVLNLGAIKLLHGMIKDLKIHPAILVKSYLAGFSPVILWSPYIASVALVLLYLNIPISEYIPVGITLAFVQFIVGNVLFWLWIKRNKLVSEQVVLHPSEEETDKNKKKILSLFITLLLLMGIVFFMESVTHWPMMFLVCLLSIGYPLIWLIFNDRFKELKKHLKDYQIQTSTSLNNEVVLFLSAGLFGRALSGTSFAAGIQLFFVSISSVSFILFCLTIMGTIVALTFLGVHQIVVVTVLLTQVDPSLIGITPIGFALLLMTSWSIASIISPINPLNIIVSNAVNESSISVGLKLNGVYVISMAIIGLAFVNIVH
ncbi:hypothetical protein M3212_16100 [Alkalihalobacillus oceani]|uniref:hypothetical protein n=1 Tax=Halalkalibacter oceani TaxID=1653776 RepID=UPI00203CBB5E|nr:hypothetical protein [Halalkalibacter oceani]MCM3762296.1 hypothetical protein [Halalkalibacter oceani]